MIRLLTTKALPSRSFPVLKPIIRFQSTKPSKQDLSFYLKHASSCVITSGVFIFVTFLSGTVFISYKGGCETIFKTAEKYDSANWLIKKGRTAVNDTIQKIGLSNYFKAENVEIFALGYLLYFCLKPVRYPLWFWMIQRCARNKRVKGVIDNQKLAAHKEHYVMQTKDKIAIAKAKKEEVRFRSHLLRNVDKK